MARKVNGIKIYPRHSGGSIASAVLCIVAALAIGFILTFVPIVSYNSALKGVADLNAFDNLAYAFKCSFDSDSLESLAAGTHFLNSDGYLEGGFETVYADLFGFGTIANPVVAWYADFFTYVMHALAYLYIALLALAIVLLIKGVLSLFGGKYPTRCKLWTAIAFFVMMFFALGSFVTELCIRYISYEMHAANGYGKDAVKFGACFWQYLLWLLLLGCWIAEHWIYSLTIKGKLYVADARKIVKKEVEEVEKEPAPEVTVTKKEKIKPKMAPKEEPKVEEPVKKEEPTPAPVETPAEPEEVKVEAVEEPKVAASEEPKTEENAEKTN